MSADRWKLICMLAQEILAEPAGHDEELIQHAAEALRDEVEAGRANQAEWPVTSRKVFRLLELAGFSVKAPPPERPRLHLIEGDG